MYALYWLLYTALEFSAMSASLDHLHAWPVYFTHWAYSLMTLYLYVYAVAVAFHVCRSPKYYCKARAPPGDTTELETLSRSPNECNVESTSPDVVCSTQESCPEETTKHLVSMSYVKRHKTLQWYFKVTWALFGVTSNTAALVMLVFFLFMWPMMGAQEPINNINIQLHAINFVIVGLDHVLTSLPVRLLHAVYSVIFGLVYILFSLILYWTGDVRPIYPVILDWDNDWQWTLITSVLFTFVAVPLIHTVFFVVFKLKEYISSKVRHSLEERDRRQKAADEPVTVL